MAKKNANAAALEQIARKLVGAKPLKRYELLEQAFLVFAAAGDAARAEEVVRLAYDPSLPTPECAVHALGTGPMDGLLHSAGQPDLTRGVPMPAEFVRRFGISDKLSLDERVCVWERGVRSDLTMDHYTQF